MLHCDSPKLKSNTIQKNIILYSIPHNVYMIEISSIFPTVNNSIGMLLSKEAIYRVFAKTSGWRLYFIGGTWLRRCARGTLSDARMASTAEWGGKTSDCQRSGVHGFREGALRRALSTAKEPARVGKWISILSQRWVNHVESWTLCCALCISVCCNWTRR